MVAMDIRSEMQCAEMEIRGAFGGSPGAAVKCLIGSYERREAIQKDSFVAALIGHMVSMRAVSASAKKSLACLLKSGFVSPPIHQALALGAENNLGCTFFVFHAKAR